MRKFLILFAVLVGAGLTGPTTKEALAQCTHLGGTVSCPVGIANGSNSLSFGANNTINWSGGQVSTGDCCPADAGLNSGAGLLNQNNQLGGPGFHWGPTTTGLDPATPDPAGGTDLYGWPGRSGPEVVVTGWGFDDNACGGGACTEGPAAAVFGTGPGDGYLCDAGGPGCGSDLWTSTPQPGFGSCGAGGCGGTPPLLPLPTDIPGAGPYAANLTSGNIDPFGGGSSFVDPITGEAIELPDDSSKWPEHVKHADALNTAYVNGEIGYPFTDPDWRTHSVEDYKNNPTLAPQAPLPGATGFGIPQTFQTEDRGATPLIGLSAFGSSIVNNPYAQNRSFGAGIDPFGGGGSFTDPRTGISESISDDPTKWPERIRHADDLNTAYVNGRIAYPFNDPNWENKTVDDFRTPQPSAPAAPLTGFGSSIAGAPAVTPGQTPVHTMAQGDTLFRVALRYGVSVDNLAAANGIAPDQPVPVGQVLTVPTSAPAPNFGSSTATAPGASSGASSDTPSGQGPKYSDKAGRFGIGSDTTLGGVGGLSARFQVAKNFGIQAIVSFTRIGLDAKEDNSDLTNYVSTVLVGPAVRGDIGLAFTNRVSLEPIIGVPTGAPAPIVGNERPAIIVAPDPAPIVGNERPAIIVKPENTNIGDSIAGNVPTEFQAPSFEVVRTGRNRAVAVSLPSYGFKDKVYLATPEGGQAMIDGLRAGKSPKEAYLDGRRADSAVRREERQKREAAERTASNQIGNALVDNVPAEFQRQPSSTTATTTPDGLASANSGGVTTPVVPAAPGSTPAPIVGNERPAIIVTPGQPGYADKSGASGIGGNRTLGGTTPLDTRSAPSGTPSTTTGTATANSGGVTTPVVPRPTRPAGESVSFLEEALVQGKTYRIEIVRTPDGRTLAVGTGDQAGHVFGEAKEGGFGWRNEGPWTPPPAPAPIVGNERPAIIVAPDSVPSSPPATLREAVEQANAPATSPASTSTVSIAPLSPQRAANMRIRLQIAGSDREQMTATANAAIDSPNSFVATGR
mgnify:CR=1 FL=1